MEKLKCVAIDDEAPALRIIEHFVQKVDYLMLVAQFRNPKAAEVWLAQNKCDVLFLDIEMPQQTGIELLATLKKKPAVVFTTAYSEFAADAFDLHAVDYLRKPFSFERFLKAVDKAMDYVKLETGKSIDTPPQAEDSEFISVKCDGKLVKIFIGEIMYIEAFHEYIKIFTEDTRYITYERMKNMEAVLPAEKFMRVHRSYIVALRKVKSFAGNSIEIAGQQIPVSREVKDELVRRVF